MENCVESNILIVFSVAQERQADGKGASKLIVGREFLHGV